MKLLYVSLSHPRYLFAVGESGVLLQNYDNIDFQGLAPIVRDFMSLSLPGCGRVARVWY